MSETNMLKPEVAKRQSEVLNALRTPATVMVVISHCLLITELQVLPFELSSHNLFLLLESWLWSFGAIAVPLFALISGYYFFYKRTSYSPRDYAEEMKKRSLSLLLPYVLWNLIAWGALYLKNKVSLEIGFAPGFNQFEYTLATKWSFLELLLLPIDDPLWYIKSLIGLSIASPLIYLSIRYLKYLGLALVVAIYVDWIPSGLGLHKATLMYFYLGAFLGYYKADILRLCTILRWPSYATAWIYFYYRAFGGDIALLRHLSYIPLFMCVVAMINIAVYLYEYFPSIVKKLSKLNPASFFVYAMHRIIIINLIRGFLYAFIPWDNDWERILTLFVLVISVPSIAYCLYYIVSYFSPRLSRVLSGGRG